MAKTLYLVRHGRTMFNEKNRIQGWCDSPLSELGRRQADEAGAFIRSRGVRFDYACCSDAGRAAETLERITDMPFDRLKGLRETFYGSLEGESTYTIDLPHTPYEQRVRMIAAAGGETYDHLRERALETLDAVMGAPGRACVLAVTHADLMRQFYAAWKGTSPVRYEEPMQNCCVLVYEYEDARAGEEGAGDEKDGRRRSTFRLVEVINRDFAAMAGSCA